VVRQSFMDGGVLGPAVWVGVENWADALDDPALRRSLWHTVLFTAMTVPAVLAVALALALLLRSVRRGAGPVRAVVYLPSLAPVVLAGLIWSFVVNPDIGLLNAAVRATGADPINWLGDSQLALPSIALLEVWRGTGFWALFLLAALLAVSKELYDAAAIDGASAWASFWSVSLPLALPGIASGIVLCLARAVSEFGATLMFAGNFAGRTQTMSLAIMAALERDFSAALALAVLLVAMAGAVLIVSRALARRWLD
jgi:ABC-type sugar transport system permease subunit